MYSNIRIRIFRFEYIYYNQNQILRFVYYSSNVTFVVKNAHYFL